MNPLAERLVEYLRTELRERGDKAKSYYLMLANEERVFVAEVPFMGSSPDMGATQGLAQVIHKQSQFVVTDDTYACLACIDLEHLMIADTEANHPVRYAITGREIAGEAIHDSPTELDPLFPALLKSLVAIIRKSKEL